MARILFVLALVCAPLCAQTPTQSPQATPDRESFLVQPKNVHAGARDIALRMVANAAGGFTTSSSRPPQVKFSAGATLRAGSFAMLNANEAECRVDIADDAVGTIDVTIELFSVNGTKVFSTLRGTLGIAGTTAVPGSQARVGAESVELVQVNVSAAQMAGAVLIGGKVAGLVSVSAPTGTQFTKAPQVTASGAEIGAPQLVSGGSVFNFNLGNAALADVSVRVGEVLLNTQLFGVSGGVEGQLAVEISGGALSGQSALVVVAHTAKTTIAGENDIAGESAPSGTKPAETNTEPDSATLPPANLNTPVDRSMQSSMGNQPRRERPNWNRGQQGQQAAPRVGGAPGASRPQANLGARQGGRVVNPPGVAPLPAPRGASPGVVPARTQDGSGAGDGRTWEGDAPEDLPAAPGGRLQGEPGSAPLDVTPGLYFCDKDFAPLGAVVLDKSVGGQAGVRVWIVLKREADKDPARVETVTVKVTVSGVTRELILTETGAGTGEFRCGKEGVLLIAPDNPDSNAEDAPAEAPKARMRY